MAFKLTSSHITSFEDGSLDRKLWTHTMHVAIAWHYCCHFPLCNVIDFLPDYIKRYNIKGGITNGYHETITIAFLFIIFERIKTNLETNCWEKFSRSNRDLLDWNPSILSRYYSDELLWSERARKQFTLPDLAEFH